ncbi:MAG TPA: hypothetical protein VHE34_09310 [Puia sp.]|uniref:hypothetical protein n=1 Tax=Puia sp. TaxID=2045100 RepID=UPI002BBD706E|nr:hypothetical protein [Puia sp.]HVU95411.1 hypothetical protein [Puia sp.]
MKKIKWLFPSLFLIALAGSAFTRQSHAKSKYTDVPGYYQNSYHYCVYYNYDDQFDNCVTDNLNYICWENAYWDGSGWVVWNQFGLGTVCWQPYYSYYSNKP